MVSFGHWWKHLSVQCGDLCDKADIRKLWGCDREAARAAYAVTCPECYTGPSRAAEESCGSCKGRGLVDVTRCPSFYCGAREQQIIRAIRQYRRGEWPIPGTLLDQANTFVRTLDWLLLLWITHEQIARKKAKDARS